MVILHQEFKVSSLKGLDMAKVSLMLAIFWADASLNQHAVHRLQAVVCIPSLKHMFQSSSTQRRVFLCFGVCLAPVRQGFGSFRC